MFHCSAHLVISKINNEPVNEMKISRLFFLSLSNIFK